MRYETPAGRQAQVDFAEFRIEFDEEPGVEHKVWLFAMVLGHSRYLWRQIVMHQDLGTVLRCHMEAFEHFGGVPQEVLYDRMKTAVLGEAPDERSIVYNDKLLKCGAHYGFVPRACQPYRAKTKGKIERPFRYVRADFFMARRFANIEDLNRQLRQWLDTVANARVHGTTDRVVAEHFAQERSSLHALPAVRFDAVLSMTGNRGFGEWADIFGDAVVDTPLLDRLLHHAVVIPIEGNSYRLREHADLIPEHMRPRSTLHDAPAAPPVKRRPGRPRKEVAASLTG